jgi:dTDP-L-rhamnose 4-epimerase
MKVLITGGAGFIGSHLADQLVASGHRVRAYDNLEPQVHGGGGRPAYLDSRVELVQGDVRDRATLRAAIDGVDVICHLAAMVGVGQSQYQIHRYTDSNVQGTATLLDLLAEGHHKVRKLLVASSMSIYGEGLFRRPSDGSLVFGATRFEAQLAAGDFEVHDRETGETLEPVPTPESKPLVCESIYALNKRDQEEYCLLFGKTYGLPVTAARFFNTYGPRQSLNNPYTGAVAIFMSRLQNGQPPLIYEDGRQTRDFVDVRDVASGCVLLLEESRADGRVFNIASGERITIAELAEQLARAAGLRIAPELTGRYRKGDTRHCFADISAARSLGFEPRYTLADGLAHLRAWSKGVEAVDHVATANAELAARGLFAGA